MAVPFSRPCYSGTNGVDRRQQHRSRRPVNNINYNRPQQLQQHQPQQQQHNRQNGGDHPVTRFLYGDGQIHLESLSLTSRIAFYALYEAWRLLQDLTSGRSTSSTSGRRRRPAPAARSATPQHIYSNNNPDLVPCGENVSTQQEFITLSNVKFDYESNSSGYVESSSSSSTFSTPRKEQQQQQVKRRRVESPDSSFYSSDEDEVTSKRGRDFTTSLSTPGLDHYQPSPVNFRTMEAPPDMIPKNYRRIINNNNMFDDELVPDYPDLVLPHVHHQQQQRRNTFYVNNTEFDESDEDEEMFDKNGFDDVDGYHGGQQLVVGGVDWSRLGSQLCQIAASFESTFYRPANDEQKAVYEAFQRIKTSCVLEAQFNKDNSLSSFAKTVCRQVLLSSIWILLKKVL